jgi:hypothetical protein
MPEQSASTLPINSICLREHFPLLNPTQLRHYRDTCVVPSQESESESHYNWQSVSQSVSQYVLVPSPIWDFWPEIFFFESYCLVIWWRPLWREVGSVICQSLSIQSTVTSKYLHKLCTFCVTHISQLQYLPLNNYIVLYTFTIKYNKIQYVQYI